MGYTVGDRLILHIKDKEYPASIFWQTELGAITGECLDRLERLDSDYIIIQFESYKT